MVYMEYFDEVPEKKPSLAIAQIRSGGGPCSNQFWQFFKSEKLSSIVCCAGGTFYFSGKNKSEKFAQIGCRGRGNLGNAPNKVC